MTKNMKQLNCFWNRRPRGTASLEEHKRFSSVPHQYWGCGDAASENIFFIAHHRIIEWPALRLPEHFADGIKTSFTDLNEVCSAVIGIGKAFVRTKP